MNVMPREEQFKAWIMQTQPFIVLQRELQGLAPDALRAIRRQLEAAFYAGQETAAAHLARLSEHPP